MLYEFHLKGLTPLIVHADDVLAADRLKEWRSAKKNKNISVPGDDRSPPWTWQTYLYTDDTYLTVPSENLMVALRQAGVTIILKGQKTFKSLTQSGLMMVKEHLSILVDGKPIEADPISKINGTFVEQMEKVSQFGFRLFVKRAKIGSKKHVRVRPRFDQWELRGEIQTLVQEFTPQLMDELFVEAGLNCGLCDWRASSPKSPGPYGKFSSELKAKG